MLHTYINKTLDVVQFQLTEFPLFAYYLFMVIVTASAKIL